MSGKQKSRPGRAKTALLKAAGENTAVQPKKWKDVLTKHSNYENFSNSLISHDQQESSSIPISNSVESHVSSSSSTISPTTSVSLNPEFVQQDQDLQDDSDQTDIPDSSISDQRSGLYRSAFVQDHQDASIPTDSDSDSEIDYTFHSDDFSPVQFSDVATTFGIIF